MAKEFSVIIATCVLVSMVFATDVINFATLKSKLVPTTKHTFTFKLCGTKLHAQITDVMAKGIDFISSDPKIASVWVKFGFHESNLDSNTISVYIVQETSAKNGKITYKRLANPEDVEGVFLPESNVVRGACGINNLVSEEERKAIVREVLKKANAV